MRIRAYGRSALLVELDTLNDVLGLHTALCRDPPPGLVESVPAARTLMVSFDPRTTTHAVLAAAVRHRPRDQPRCEVRPEVEIPVRYDGEDLGEVARASGCSRRHLVKRHVSRIYVVALIGFAPGFYFLTGGDEALQARRRATPRTRVPRGAVGLAGEFTGIYPRTGPGGWKIIGHTEAHLWDASHTPSVLLPPGTRIRFTEVPR